MDTVLIVLTCASAAAAAAFGFSAWRARADEAERSAARVAALSAAIDGSEAPEPASAFALPATADKKAGPHASSSVAITSMFATAPGGSVQGRPLVKMGVMGALATAFIVIVAMANRDHIAPAAPPADEAALELVSMRHTRDSGTLTVSGLVRNPREGAPRSHITAVVFAFDRRGEFIASGRAGLDFTNLAPGDESPFVVKIPGVAGAARYRVSFRTEDGVVRHLDRRAELAGGLPPSLQASAGRRSLGAGGQASLK